ncbi:MAG: hypothetical protein HSCHL_2002 [Hydrogenibacillus schlegelii]|uniref:Uncharacterized protein n=1 Tax=Hydrogenibacillus schlegelii TaxID=1484 RepID=A0A2T5GBD8_HYDSH|nr:MAG: hypothetical protein HSCHL_2002 [Hydrogenibacillus schlegelii]
MPSATNDGALGDYVNIIMFVFSPRVKGSVKKGQTRSVDAAPGNGLMAAPFGGPGPNLGR